MLVVSLHRFPFYPGASGDPRRVGSGAGRGFNINIGWPSGGVNDAAYAHARTRSHSPTRCCREATPSV